MLYLAEGQIRQPIAGDERAQVAAWLGPMVDSGFLQSGYVDAARTRIVMVLSAPDQADVEQRLRNLPVVQDGTVTFSLTRVTAVRFV
jgi:hypothetical protein